MGRIARQVASAIKELATTGRGNVPAFLCRWAEELMKPSEVPWEQELAMVTRHACAWRENAADHRYDAPSRRQAGIGYGPGKPILPRLRMPMPDVHVIFDTSGSMGTDELSQGGVEVNAILRAVGANITLCTCDAAVTGITKVRTIKDALKSLKGGGGTDMRPAFDAIMKTRPRPQVIVCLTDLHIGDPGVQPQGVKVIWVGVGKYQGPDPAWGRTIRIKKNKEEAA
jgi:predicted metal-dependent peptidase